MPPRVSTNSVPNLAIATEKLADRAVTAAKRKWSMSVTTTGTGSEQLIAHGLGVKPAFIIVIIRGSPTTYTALTVSEGTHDATYARVGVTSGWKYRVYAEA